jgi:peptide deformylase
MTVLPLVIAPDPFLNQPSATVEVVDDEVRQLLDDMLETMYASHGIGLAAVQVGVHKRVVVVDVEQPTPRYENDAAGPGKPIKMVNPEIVTESDSLNEYDEGCLSFPGQYSSVTRPEKVTVKYLDENGQPQQLEADGLLATCIQHEIDHTNGIVFVDHISKLKRNMILKKLTKAKKAGVFEGDCGDPSCGHDHH